MRRPATARVRRRGRTAPSRTPSGVRAMAFDVNEPAMAAPPPPPAAGGGAREKKRRLDDDDDDSGEGGGEEKRKRRRTRRAQSKRGPAPRAVSVYVRVKNEAAGDRACATDAPCLIVHDAAAGSIEVLKGKGKGKGQQAAKGSGRGKAGKLFKLDGVFPAESTQHQVYERVGEPLLDACFKGYNGTILAYGQTGSGKTYTMLGDPTSEDLAGLTPRVVHQLYIRIENERVAALERGKVFRCTVSCSMVEIYNEKVFDLLAKGKECSLRENKGEVFVEGVERTPIAGVRDALERLTTGDAQRHVEATAMNKESSRSHSVFTLWCEMSWGTAGIDDAAALGDVREVTAKLNLVDLAGSESAKHTKTTGARMKEGNNINQSLSALGNVVRKLVPLGNGPAPHVNYRGSKLTWLLRDSLGGNSLTTIVTTVSPAIRWREQTKSTLTFAMGAKRMKNDPHANDVTKPSVQRLQAQVRQLKQDLAEARTEIERGSSHAQALTIPQPSFEDAAAAEPSVGALLAAIADCHSRLDVFTYREQDMSAVKEEIALLKLRFAHDASTAADGNAEATAQSKCAELASQLTRTEHELSCAIAKYEATELHRLEMELKEETSDVASASAVSVACGAGADAGAGADMASSGAADATAGVTVSTAAAAAAAAAATASSAKISALEAEVARCKAEAAQWKADAMAAKRRDSAEFERIEAHCAESSSSGAAAPAPAPAAAAAATVADIQAACLQEVAAKKRVQAAQSEIESLRSREEEALQQRDESREECEELRAQLVTTRKMHIEVERRLLLNKTTMAMRRDQSENSRQGNGRSALSIPLGGGDRDAPDSPLDMTMLKNPSSALPLGRNCEQIFVQRGQTQRCVSRYAPGALGTVAPALKEGPYSVFDDAEVSGK